MTINRIEVGQVWQLNDKREVCQQLGSWSQKIVIRTLSSSTDYYMRDVSILKMDGSIDLMWTSTLLANYKLVG